MNRWEDCPDLSKLVFGAFSSNLSVSTFITGSFEQKHSWEAQTSEPVGDYVCSAGPASPKKCLICEKLVTDVIMRLKLWMLQDTAAHMANYSTANKIRCHPCLFSIWGRMFLIW